MEPAFRFEKLMVYQRAVAFSLLIYQITNKWSSAYRFNLTNQLQRAALSISLNIAEGTSRSKKDFQHFLAIARGSCFECIPLITIASQLQLIIPKDKQTLYNEVYELSKMLSSLRTSVLTN